LQSKKYITYIFICISVFTLGVLAGYVSAAGKKEYIYIDSPSAAMTSLQDDVKKAPQPLETDRRTFLIKSLNNKLYIYLNDNSNNLQLDSEIDYIDLYSLDPTQQEELKSGVILPDREAVAEYIQDLGS